MAEHEVMRAEVKADCYDGPSCDQVTTHFDIYCDGDMDSDTGTEDIVIRLAELPPGARISVTYPCCPECGIPRGEEFERLPGGGLKIIGHKNECDCGFDWQQWVLNQYS